MKPKQKTERYEVKPKQEHMKMVAFSIHIIFKDVCFKASIFSNVIPNVDLVCL